MLAAMGRLLARARARDQRWRAAWSLLYAVGAVLEAIPRHPAAADMQRARALAERLESSRTATSARLIDAVEELLLTRFPEDHDAAMAAYDELEAAMAEFRSATGAVTRSRQRVIAILGGASLFAWVVSTLLARFLRLAIARESLTWSPTPVPDQLVIRLLGGLIVTGIMLWALHRVRPPYGWWLAVPIAAFATVLPEQLWMPIFTWAGTLDDFLYNSFGLDVSQVVLRVPFYSLGTWATAVVVVTLVDEWRRRDRTKKSAGSRTAA
jgi:hypothetical protein